MSHLTELSSSTRQQSLQSVGKKWKIWAPSHRRKKKNVSRVSEFKMSLNIWQKSFKLFLLPFANHFLRSCENYNWQCLSPLYCYKNDFWKSKGCTNHFTVQHLDFGWCWLQHFKALSLCHEDGGESKLCAQICTCIF